MSDEELRHLTPEQVVALVRRLESLLAAAVAGLAELEGQVAAAVARSAELEAALAARGGPPRTPANSSTPESGLETRAPAPPRGRRQARAPRGAPWDESAEIGRAS